MKLISTVITASILGLHSSTAWSPAASKTFTPFTSKSTSTSLYSSAEATSQSESGVDSSQYDLSLFSPCKINLFLRIIRKREDGYHDLASLFQTIGFGDMLHLKLLDGDDVDSDVFECNMEGVPTDKTNLVIRALDLVRTKTGNEDKFFKANLVKQVPAQAGLGGGSGNAAAAMWGANQLLGNPATLEEVSDR
jgi:4-diphosphocytidyl-2-C-methyl-D-erythritol kinase